MNKTLLINRIDPENYSKEKKKIFFLIGRLNIPYVEGKLINTLQDIDILKKNDIIYKYNGVELNIKEEKIPSILEILVDSGMEIYSVYEKYNPKL